MSRMVSTTRTTTALPTMPTTHIKSTRKTETFLYSVGPRTTVPHSSNTLPGLSGLLPFSVVADQVLEAKRISKRPPPVGQLQGLTNFCLSYEPGPGDMQKPSLMRLSAQPGEVIEEGMHVLVFAINIISESIPPQACFLVGKYR